MNFSFCIHKLAVAFYVINEIQPKIKFQNIVQCPFNKACSIHTVAILKLKHGLGGTGWVQLLLAQHACMKFKTYASVRAKASLQFQNGGCVNRANGEIKMSTNMYAISGENTL